MSQNFSHDQTPFTQKIDLTDYFHIVRKRKWIIISFFLFVFSIVAIKTFSSTPVYKATAKIIIEGQSSKAIDMRSRIPRDIIEEDYYKTQYNLLESRGLASSVIEDLKLKEFLASNRDEKPNYLNSALKRVKKYIRGILTSSDSDATKTPSMPSSWQSEGEYVFKDRDSVVDWYLKNLEITPVQQTKLVNISFSGEFPELTVLVANAHARAFIKRSIVIQTSASQDTLEWIKKQLGDQKVKVETSRRAIHEYAKAANMQSLGNREDIIYQKLIDLESILTRARAERVEMATKFGPKHPRMIELNAEIKKLEQEFEAQKQVVMSYKEKAIKYDVLRHEAETNQDTYDFLLRQANETSLNSAMEISNIQIVDEAEVPRSPYKPKIFLNIILAMVLGLTFGTGLAFFFDYMDNTMRNPEDIMEHLGMPVIGVLPYDKSLKKSKTPALPFNDSYHERNKRIGNYTQYYNVSGSLVACLPLNQSGMSGQILMVESSVAGEGKTTILAKSAISLARGGQRVVMVDADLIRSSLHRVFGLKNNGEGGLVNAMERVLSQKMRQGDLNKCSVDDLFSLIALKKHSGQLIITNDTQSMTAIFGNGRLFHIQSQEGFVDNRLGSTLLRGGFVTESQLKDALERNKRTGQPLGYVLINSGYITQDKLQGPLKLQVEENLQILFSWKQGTFVFKQYSTEFHEDKRISFQEDYKPIINRLGRTTESCLIKGEVLSCVRSVNEEPNLSILPAGIGHAKAEGALYFALLAKFLDILKQRFDVVLVDMPPVLPAMGYVKPLLPLVDGVIFVVKSGHVSVKDVNKAVTYMKEAKANIIGTILNQVEIGNGYYNYERNS